MKCNKFFAGFLGVVFILLSVHGRADELEELRAAGGLSSTPFRGMEAVAVAVIPLGKDVEADGLTSDQLRRDVELRLRKAGIRVLSETELKEKPLTPVLYVHARIMKGKGRTQGLYLYHLLLTLIEPVRLVRNPAIATSASTWESKSSIGTVGTENVRELREPVADATDEFANEFLAANPKK